MAVEAEHIEGSQTIKKIKNRLLVLSGKGGVGKSTVAANLAMGFVRKQLNTGLLDTDTRGLNLAKALGAEDKKMKFFSYGTKPVNVNDHLKLVSTSLFHQDPYFSLIWQGPMKMKAIQYCLLGMEWGELDWLVINTPPEAGYEQLSIAELIPSTYAIIVTTPQEVSCTDTRKAVAFARRHNLKILGIIENMSGIICPRCGERIDIFNEGEVEKVSIELGVPFLGKIPIDPQIAGSEDIGKPLIAARPDSEVSIAIMEIVEKIINKKVQ